jgi:hypothetical protein
VVGAEPVGVAVEVQDNGSVQDPVEHGGDDGGVAGSTTPCLRVASAPLLAGEHPRAIRSYFAVR